MVAENYPQLKSNENFLRLQDELSGTENRIALRAASTTKRCNITTPTIQLFPDNIVASISGFTPQRRVFQDRPGADKAPKVTVLKTPHDTQTSQTISMANG